MQLRAEGLGCSLRSHPYPATPRSPPADRRVTPPATASRGLLPRARAGSVRAAHRKPNFPDPAQRRQRTAGLKVDQTESRVTRPQRDEQHKREPDFDRRILPPGADEFDPI